MGQLAPKPPPPRVVGHVRVSPGAGGTHHRLNGQPHPIHLDREPPFFPVNTFDANRSANGKLVPTLVIGEVVHYVVAGGVLLLSAGHEPPGQRAVPGGREATQGAPPVAPGTAGSLLRIEDYERQVGAATQVVA